MEKKNYIHIPRNRRARPCYNWDLPNRSIMNLNLDRNPNCCKQCLNWLRLTMQDLQKIRTTVKTRVCACRSCSTWSCIWIHYCTGNKVLITSSICKLRRACKELNDKNTIQLAGGEPFIVNSPDSKTIFCSVPVP